jgi:hypothetical protein
MTATRNPDDLFQPHMQYWTARDRLEHQANEAWRLGQPAIAAAFAQAAGLYAVAAAVQEMAER